MNRALLQEFFSEGIFALFPSPRPNGPSEFPATTQGRKEVRATHESYLMTLEKIRTWGTLPDFISL